MKFKRDCRICLWIIFAAIIVVYRFFWTFTVNPEIELIFMASAIFVLLLIAALGGFNKKSNGPGTSDKETKGDRS